MITNKKHQIFADEYILTSDAILSYQKAYPNVTKETARVNYYKLLQNTTIADYIQEAKERIRIARENNLADELKSKDSSGILKREQIIEMTSKVVKMTYDSFVKSKDKQDADSFNKSVAVYSKLEGLDKPSKSEIDVLINKVEPVIFTCK